MKRFLPAIGIALVFDVPSVSAPYVDVNFGDAEKKEFFRSEIIQGTVTNSTGEPLANATVQVKGTGNTIITGQNRSFLLAVPASAATLF